MKKIRGLSQWLTNNENQIDWTWDQLIAFGAMPPNIEDTSCFRDQVLTALHQVSRDTQGREFISQMRKDWSKEKYTRNPNNQGITLTLSPSIIRKLDGLSKNSTRRKILETLITMGHSIERDMEKVKREEILEEKKRLELQWPKKPHGQVTVSQDNYNNLKTAFKTQECILDELLFEYCQLKVLTEKSNLMNNNLSDEQKILALNKYKNLKEYNSKKLSIKSL